MDETYFGKEVPKLGFGLMRLPKKGFLPDVKKTSQMVDRFLEAGFKYFDPAYVYPGSESATRKALVKRHTRDSYLLATKLYAPFVAPTEKMAKKELETSLRRTGAEYFDFYLLHSLMASNVGKYERFHLWDFVAEQKKKGTIRYAGFSYHSGPELLDRLLTEHPEVDFVQLQINYEDWENPRIASRANYEVARKHGKSIVVMEPIKGGRLAMPPKKVRELLQSYDPEASPASWAIRFAASLDGIITVLSGMSTLGQVEDNISFMKDFRPLSEEEQDILRQARELLGSTGEIACTACRYCMKGCPKNIPIPEIFEAANRQLGSGQLESAKQAYARATRRKGKASDCIRCRQCEEACPQHLPVTELLEQCSEMLEKK
jgi:predicted aldo/keto reductase-like oxidoreductase